MAVADLLGVGPPPELLRSVVLSHLARDEFAAARAVARRLRATARDGDLVVECEYLLAVVAFWSAQLGQAEGQFERVIGTFRDDRRPAHHLRFGHDPKLICMSRLALTQWLRGRPVEAAATRDAAVALATEVAQPFGLRITHLFTALLAIELGDDDRVRRDVAVLGEGNLAVGPFQMPLTGLRGYVHVLDGRTDAGVGTVRAAMEAQATDAHAPGMSAILARLHVAAHDRLGDPHSGLAAADEALRTAGSRLCVTFRPNCSPGSRWRRSSNSTGGLLSGAEIRSRLAPRTQRCRCCAAC